jgi:Putative protein-S-isoprenylcysteine methyltransferase
LFAAFHSATATETCKGMFYGRGMSARAYRLLYSLVSVVLTVLWMAFVHSLPDSPLYQVHAPLSFGLRALQVFGLFVVVQSFRVIDARVFLGLAAAPDGKEPFRVQGVYRRVRHPMYSGVMLMLLANPSQSVNSLHMLAVIGLYFLIGSRLEERRLLAVHPGYADYRLRVPAFIPRFRWRLKS